MLQKIDLKQRKINHSNNNSINCHLIKLFDKNASISFKNYLYNYFHDANHIAWIDNALSENSRFKSDVMIEFTRPYRRCLQWFHFFHDTFDDKLHDTIW